MGKFTEKMTAMNCDAETALERFVDSESYWISCVERVLGDPGFERLSEELEAGDFDKAFAEAHALKGIIGNVGMTDMFNAASELVELLRTGAKDGVPEAFAKLAAMRDMFARELAEFF